MPDNPLFYSSNVVVASPTDDTETVVCVINSVVSSYAGQEIKLRGWVAIGFDVDVTATVLRIRRGSLTGAIVEPQLTYTTPESTSVNLDIEVVDAPGALASATYVLTVQVIDASDTSVLEGVSLTARVD